MPDENQIEEWRREAREQGPRIYGFVNPDFTSIHFRVDSKGRARQLQGNVPWTGTIDDFVAYPGIKLPKFPSTHRYGYKRAVAAEHEMLMNDLLCLPRWSLWRDDVLSQVDGLAVPYTPCDCYECWVQHCKGIAVVARNTRPLMMAAIEPAPSASSRCGPWGIGWLTQQFCWSKPTITQHKGHTQVDSRSQAGPR